MKSILIFFLVIFIGLGAGVYFYETQIASPKAADALVKSKKKKQKKPVVNTQAFVKKSSLSTKKMGDTIATPTKVSRVIDLANLANADSKESKERQKKHREVERSIRNTIKKSVSLDIQKAVVTEISKKR